jgi:hypothetical protein
MLISKFNKYNLFSKSVIKAVHIDEIDGRSIVVINFGYFKITLIMITKYLK